MTRALPELTTPPDAFLTTASLPEGSRASENASSISGGAWRTMLPASGNAWPSTGRAFKADVPPIKNNAATVVLRPNNRRHVIFMRDEQFRGVPPTRVPRRRAGALHQRLPVYARRHQSHHHHSVKVPATHSVRQTTGSCRSRSWTGSFRRRLAPSSSRRCASCHQKGRLAAVLLDEWH